MAREINVGMPGGLDIGATYTLRVTAIDPSSGNLIAGVNVGAVTITCDEGTISDGGQVTYGDWFLVPGPGA